jgi:hypothetical protein
MIRMVRADELKPNDTFSTDGYMVQSVYPHYDGRLSITLQLYGHVKKAIVPPEQPFPIWTPDA